MSEHHFNYFRVKNFKRFKDLEVKDIGQYNLLLGDNNVGKTSLLEALSISFPIMSENAADYHYRLVLKLAQIKGLKGNRIWDYLVNNINPRFSDNLSHPVKLEFYNHQIPEGEFKKIEIEIGGLGIIEVNFSGYESEVVESTMFRNPLTDEFLEDFYMPFVPFYYRNDSQIARTYSDLSLIPSHKKDVINGLKFILPRISNIEIYLWSRTETLAVTEIGKPNAVPLSYYGEGTQKSILLILLLIRFKGYPVMIDEIDAGIHYSRMKDYWKVILQSAKENNVQLFASTHNRECIQYFIEALEELGEEYQEKSRSIRLVEHAQTKEILSFTNSFKKIEEELAIGNEVR